MGHDLRPGEEPREEGRERRVEPGRKRPDRDQGVHVRRPLAGRLDRSDEEPAPDPEDNRRRQEKEDHQQRLPGDSHQKREPVLHRAQEDDAGKDDPDGKAGFQILELLLAGRADRVLAGVIGNPEELVPLIGDHLPERLDAGPAGVV